MQVLHSLEYMSMLVVHVRPRDFKGSEISTLRGGSATATTESTTAVNDLWSVLCIIGIGISKKFRFGG